MSEDKPKIRLHRHERILAVKWPGDEHWLMIWPDPYPDLAPPGKKDFCTAEPFIAAPADARQACRVGSDHVRRWRNR